MAWALLGQRAVHRRQLFAAIALVNVHGLLAWSRLVCHHPPPSRPANARTSGRPWCTYMIRRLGYQGRGMYRMHTTCSHLTQFDADSSASPTAQCSCSRGRTHEDPPIWRGPLYSVVPERRECQSNITSRQADRMEGCRSAACRLGITRSRRAA